MFTNGQRFLELKDLYVGCYGYKIENLATISIKIKTDDVWGYVQMMLDHIRDFPNEEFDLRLSGFLEENK